MTSTDPKVGRPTIPSVYGVPTGRKGLRSWDEVAARIATAEAYWVATLGRGGAPRIRPVDGNFVDGVLYLTGSPAASWARDLVARPAVSVSLDNVADVVILEGDAEHLARADDALAQRIADAAIAKYPQYGQTVDNFRGPGVFAVRPRVVVAWKQFPRDVTRFSFDAEASD